MGVMLAALEAVKLALAFLPNVELVTLFIIIFARYRRYKVYFVAIAFAVIEGLIWGFGVWTISYLYIWPLLVLFTIIIKSGNVWIYSILSGFFGLLFGAFCSIPYLFVGGPASAIGWWIAGIPWDMVHGVSNFIICAILFVPLDKVAGRFLGGD